MAQAISNLFVEFTVSNKQFVDSMKEMGKSINELNKIANLVKPRLAELGTVMSVGLTAPLLAVGAAAFSASDDIQKALNSIRKATGDTGAAFEDLKADFMDVFANVPDSAQDVATALSTVKQRTGETGTQLAATATEFLNLSRVTGIDVETGIRLATRAFNDWGIVAAQQPAELNFLRNTMTQTGIHFDALATQIQYFGVPLRELGFGFEQSSALLGLLDKSGVNTDQVMMALRRSLVTFSKDGVENASDTLIRLIAQIKTLYETGDVSKANKLAVSIFGQRGGAGPALAAAIGEGKFDYKSTFDAISNSKDTIDAAAFAALNFGEKLAVLQHQAEEALLPLGNDLMKAVLDLTPAFKSSVRGASDLIDAFHNMTSAAKDAAFAVGGLLLVLGPGLMILTKLAPAFVGAGVLIARTILGIAEAGAALQAAGIATIFKTSLGTLATSGLSVTQTLSGLSGVAALSGTALVSLGAIAVGVGALLGYTFGELFNSAVRFLGLEPRFDSFMATLAHGALGFLGLKTAEDELAAANAGLSTAQTKLIARYMEQGHAVDVVRLSDAQYRASLLETIRVQEQAAAANERAKAAKGATGPLSDEAYKLTAGYAEDQKAIKDLVDSTTREDHEALYLTDAIKSLNAAHISSASILDVLGPKAEAFAHKLELQNKPIPSLIANLAALNDQNKLNIKTLSDFQKTMESATSPFDSLSKELTILTRLFGQPVVLQAFAEEIVTTGNKTLDLGQKLTASQADWYRQAQAVMASRTALGEYRKESDDTNAALLKNARTPGEVADEFQRLKEAGTPMNTVMQSMGSSIEAAYTQMQNGLGTLTEFQKRELAAAENTRRTVQGNQDLVSSNEKAMRSLDDLGKGPLEVASAFEKMRLAGASAGEITQSLGPDIEKYAKQLREIPGSIDPVSAASIRMADAMRLSAQGSNDIVNSAAKDVQAFKELSLGPQEVVEAFTALRAAGAGPGAIMAIIGDSVAEAAKKLRELGPKAVGPANAALIEFLDVMRQTVGRNNELVDSIAELKTKFVDIQAEPVAIADKFTRLLGVTQNLHVIMALMGPDIEKAIVDWRQLGIYVDANTAATLKHAAAAQASLNIAQQWSDGWKSAILSIESNTSSMVTQVLFQGKTMADGLKSIFQDLAADIIKVLIDGALSSLAAKLNGLTASGSVLGTIGSGLLSLLSINPADKNPTTTNEAQSQMDSVEQAAILAASGVGAAASVSSAISAAAAAAAASAAPAAIESSVPAILATNGGGLFALGAAGAAGVGAAGAAGVGAAGAGAAVAGDTFGAASMGALGAVPGTAIGTTGSTAGLLGGLSATGVGVAIAGAVGLGLIINHFVGEGRKQANDFVQQIQNPFGNQLAALSGAVQQEQAAGTLTPTEITQTEAAMQTLIQQFTAAGQQFAAEGPNQAKVVAQAMQTMTQDFGPNFSNLFTSLQLSLKNLTQQTALAAQPQSSVTGDAISTASAATIQTASTTFSNASADFANAVDRAAANSSPVGAQQVNIPVTVNANFTIDGSGGPDMTSQQVVQQVMPAITQALKSGIQGYRAAWAQIFTSSTQGIISTKVAVPQTS